MNDETRQTNWQQVRYLAFPYSVSGAATPNTTTADEHLRELILQVLFTNPGERVNLPEFGAGLQRLIFAPNSDVLRASVQFLVTTNLQRWLGERINVEQVIVSSEPGEQEKVTLEIVYIIKKQQLRERLRVQV